jgi:hypothetical protein
MLSIITDTLLKVTLNISKTVHHGLHFIADNLLKVALNTNKTGHHVIVLTDILLENHRPVASH